MTSPRVQVVIPFFLPRRLYSLLRWAEKRRFPKGTQDLWGDRDIEWSFCAAHMPTGPGEALDFGCGESWMSLLAARRGFTVTAIDLEQVQWPYVHPRLRFVQQELSKLEVAKRHFDLVINSSTVEHVGLAGRFGVLENQLTGDLEAMAFLKEMMKPDGIMLLTIPVGDDAVHPPWHRVYGARRLPQLLQGYVVTYEEFWVKDETNRWRQRDKNTALSFKSTSSMIGRRNVYALGCFLLQRSRLLEYSKSVFINP